MSVRVPPLTPYPLPVLLGRCAREWRRDGALFDLRAGRFWRADPAVDLKTEAAGAPLANPVGLAAGPHTQLAQNIALGWLAGARAFELKTVQILDELEIGRPCIDMATVGYNVEWSQELTLERSLEEYAKASMLIEILGGWQELRPALGVPGPHQLELSLGYDLAGVSSPRIGEFIARMRNAGPVIDDLRSHIPPPFEEFRDLPFRTRLVEGATLSTFHGCPPDEISAIARHLMTEHELDVTVKLNPTLLGFERTRDILHGRLGYREIRLVPEAFARDLTLDRAVAMISELDDFARARGRVFGIKLSNTLVVGNHKGRLPGERMYMSGPPLHAVAAALLDEVAARLPGALRLAPEDGGTVPVAFSAGVGRANFAETVGLGVAPVTVCSDLLRPGGYGRLSGMLRALERALREADCAGVREWLARRCVQARAAGLRDAAAAYAAALATPDGSRPYTRATVEKTPRTTDAHLALWDCSACGICVGVCPNNAMLSCETPDSLAGELSAPRQLFCLAELCNACGNCETFCPEEGAPFALKPRLFLDPVRHFADGGPAFLIAPAESGAVGSFTVRAAQAWAAETARLAAILNAPGGLPLRPEDLA